MTTPKPNHNFVFIMPFLLAITLSVGVLLGWFLSSGSLNSSQANSQRFAEVLNIIEQNYVDSIDTEQLTQSSIQAMLQNLDPHSQYIPKIDVQVTDAQLESHFDGIGIEFVIQNDTLLVLNTLPNGPSYSAGVRAGDKIIAVNGDTIANTGLTNQKVFKLLRGNRGSTVSLGVIRGAGTDTLVHRKVVRDIVQSTSVEVAYMYQPTTGYIKISRFASNTHQEFVKALHGLKKLGMQRLILDLRDNPGGLMSQAIYIADELVGGKHLLVYTKGHHVRNSEQYYSKPGDNAEQLPTMVLINEGSASASEVLAGALQDIDRALIVGRRSYGKGLVQSPLTLSDGAKLRITISRYHTPSGRCIQKPYVHTNKYRYDLETRFAHGEMFSQDSIKQNDSLVYKTTNGRTVYGGGGIMPDVFVPMDTSLNTKLLSHLVAYNLIRQTALNYYNTHLTELEKLNPEDFINNYQPDTSLLTQLRFAAVSQGLKIAHSSWQQHQNVLNLLLKAHLGRALWRNKVFYPIIHKQDSLLHQTNNLWDKANNLPYF